MTGLNQANDISSGVGTVVIELIPTEQNRKFLLIQNVSTVFIGISLHGGTPVVDVNGIGSMGTVVLGPMVGLILDSENIPGNAINAVASAGLNNPVTVIQW
jgi:hypothetical protein